MQFTKKKITAVLATTVVVALGAGVAVAYWTSTGNDASTGGTGVSADFVVDAAAAAKSGGPLTPGGAAPTWETHHFSVTNPSSGHQILSNVTVTVAAPDGSPWTTVPGCSAADYTVTPIAWDASFAYGDMAPAATITGSVVLKMNNLASDQDACQGATVPLYFLAT